MRGMATNASTFVTVRSAHQPELILVTVMFFSLLLLSLSLLSLYLSLMANLVLAKVLKAPAELQYQLAFLSSVSIPADFASNSKFMVFLGNPRDLRQLPAPQCERQGRGP